MTSTRDLHIAEEIVPLFDYTQNDFSRKVLAGLLQEPLVSLSDIIERQQILKAFIASHSLLKNYSYSRVDLAETHQFLEQSFPVDQPELKRWKLQLLLSPKQRYRRRAQLVQAVLLLHKLKTWYFSRLDAGLFPEPYRGRLRELYAFLSDLNLDHYEFLIREQQFFVKHMVALTASISEKAGTGAVTTFWKGFFLFEAYLSLSIGIVRQQFVFPLFSEDRFCLTGVYHPLLRAPVANSICTDNNVVLLTGANMSGKSTFLKAVGICVYLAHTGVGVPAADCVLPFFDTLSVAIDLRDDIRSGYSHFMSEVMNLKDVVVAAGGSGRCFAIFDELFRGTNLEDALEISATTIKGLAKFRRSVFFLSTHLHPLKEVPEVKEGKVACYYFDCGLEGDRPVFSYRLKPGWSEMKVGRLLFQKEGLDRLLAVDPPAVSSLADRSWPALPENGI